MKKGFSLSEVLITLGVIGAVSAITLPSVINNIQEKQFHSKFKKAYAAFSQAAQRIYAEDGEFTSYDYPMWANYVCKLGNYMKITASGQNCGNKYKYVKWHKNGEWFDIKNNSPSIPNTDYYATNFTFITYDGTMYMLNCHNQVLVDVNGFKKPNKVGKDIYYFHLKSSTNMPFYPINSKVPDCQYDYISITDSNYREDCKSGSGWGCSRMVINNELK